MHKLFVRELPLILQAVRHCTPMILDSRSAEMSALSALARESVQNHLVSGTREPGNTVSEVIKV